MINKTKFALSGQRISGIDKVLFLFFYFLQKYEKQDFK